MPDRPNILLIMTDQQQAAAMGCAGNRTVSTHAMDRLAAEGMRCTRAYTTFPLCVPARSSLFTGRMPSTIGSMFNGPGIPADRVPECLGNLLRAAGYATAYAGKWHAPEIDMRPQYGFERLCGFDDTRVARECAAFIRQSRQEPFFLVASFDNPHNICEHARDQNLPWGPVPEPVSAGACPNLPPNFCIPPFEPEAIDLCARDMPHIAHRGRLSPERWRLYRHVYFRLVEKVDREIGRILAALDEAGVADDTLVLFTSDHGDHAGAHQLGQKTFLYEEAVRIPFLLRWPGRIGAGRTCQRLVSPCLDIYPTLAALAGAAPPADLPGLDLAGLFQSADAVSWRDQLVVQTTLLQSADPRHGKGRALCTGRFKYALYNWGAWREQLFDLESDPGEMVNLAVDAAWADTLREHRCRLDAWMRENRDSIASGGGGRKSTGVPGCYPADLLASPG